MTDKPTCTMATRLCTPRLYPGPSGVRFRHTPDCPDRPGEPISVADYAQHRTWPPAKARR